MKAIVSLLARRFLTGRKRSRFLSFISAVSLFGVAVGVAALVVVMAVMEGFETKLRSLITSHHSHVILYSAKHIIRDKEAMSQRLLREFDGIEAVSSFIYSEVMLAHKGRVVGSLIEGVDREGAERTTRVLEHISQGEFPRQGLFNDGEGMGYPDIVIGSVIADELAVDVGEIVTVVSPFFDSGTLQPRTRRFRVSGILSTGMYEYDSKYSIISAQEAQSFFRLPAGSASALRIRTADPNKSYELATEIRKELGFPYLARDWTQLNQNLLYAVRLQKIVIFIVLTSIVVVAAFNIMSTLVIMMDEKKREMSILKAMGLTPGDSAKIFSMVGAIIGGSGAVAGAALGLIICQVLARTRFIHLPPDVYFISYLPVDMRPLTLLLVVGASFGVAMIATIYPSWRAAAESPIEGLRYE